jgi:4-amino-4-deoxy-L-arabinose transferase-like glycosyltransferase
LPQANNFPAARAGRRAGFLLLLVLGFALFSRAALAPGSTEANMDPDAAHFLNIARMFREGLGFMNPAAWPAWIQPARLPMPETFKEPGYPWLIAALGGTFRAGQAISLVAGVLLPWATYALARRRALGTGAATLAALLVAASPLLLLQSVRVMVDSVFALVVTLLFLAASRDARDPGRNDRSVLRDLAAGVLFGAAYLLRAQTMILLVPLLALLFERRTLREGLVRTGLALAAAAVVSAPFWLRNLALFHTPFYSDVVAYGLWPYVDHLTFSHGLEHPPAIAPFVLAHVPQVIAHMASSFVHFFVHVLPDEIVGHAFWMLPLAAGVLVSLRAPETWRFAWLYLGITLLFIMAVHWDARYFTSSVPLYCLLAASGAMTLADRLANLTLVGPVKASALLVASTVAVVLLQVMVARRQQAEFAPPELAAARKEASFLKERLKPDEAVLAVTTSYWSWFAKRNSVHLVIADESRFDGVMRRLKVRWAALPTSRLPEFAARYPEGALPRSLVFDHADSSADVTIFRVQP